MLHRLVFLRLKPCQRTPKTFWIWSNQNQDFRFKRWRLRSHWKKKGMNHKLPSFRCSLKIQRHHSCEIFTQRFPLFSTDFRFSTRMLIFRKQTRKQRISFSPSPSLKYLDFYDVSKNSEHINTFRRGPTQKSPSRIPKFNFLVNTQNGKVSKLSP
jgi:hypothetical protein